LHFAATASTPCSKWISTRRWPTIVVLLVQYS
jgi:hypothetical protein